jgi:hypothetical protein
LEAVKAFNGCVACCDMDSSLTCVCDDAVVENRKTCTCGIT